MKSCEASTIPKDITITDLVPPDNLLHQTEQGVYINGDSLEFLSSSTSDYLTGKVDLILTSPPFPLNKKKSYGNLTGSEYLEWFGSMAPIFSRLLSARGSLVIELGNSID